MEFNVDMFIVFLTSMSLLFLAFILVLDSLSKRYVNIRVFEDRHRLKEQFYYGILLYNGLSLTITLILLFIK